MEKIDKDVMYGDFIKFLEWGNKKNIENNNRAFGYVEIFDFFYSRFEIDRLTKLEEQNKRELKKYIVFIIDDYYPSGGLSDIEDSFDSLYKAKEIEKEIMKNKTCSESYIVDRDTWEKIL